MPQVDRFDVIVVGGGPVGLSMALALVQSARGMRVALVDRRPLTVPSDNRASAIAASVRRLFEALGVWSGMEAAAQPIREMRITDSGSGDIARPLFLTFDGDVGPGEPFAHMVPNSASIGALLSGLNEGVTIVAPAEIATFADAGSEAHLDLAGGRRLVAPLVIAAVRRMGGIGTLGHDYGQTGLVATIAHELPHDGVAYEHFRPAGPFASLPLPGNRSSLVWTETTAEASRLLNLDKAALAGEIEAAMGSSLGAVTVEDKLTGFPLRLQIAREFVGPRLALIGDAAHVIHPIAGQGLNLGLKDVAALAEVVVEALRLGLDAGAPDVLARYQRRLDTAAMAAATDGLNRLFSNDMAPVRALRDLGLGLVDRTPLAKSAFIRTAAGVSGNNPRLLSGLPI